MKPIGPNCWLLKGLDEDGKASAVPAWRDNYGNLTYPKMVHTKRFPKNYQFPWNRNATRKLKDLFQLLLLVAFLFENYVHPFLCVHGFAILFMDVLFSPSSYILCQKEKAGGGKARNGMRRRMEGRGRRRNI